jgi:hypothetical protein
LDVRPVSLLLRGYIALKILPFVLASLIGGWVKRRALTRSPPEMKRTASLQHRGLFDFFSPFTAFLAARELVQSAQRSNALQPRRKLGAAARALVLLPKARIRNLPAVRIFGSMQLQICEVRLEGI